MEKEIGRKRSRNRGQKEHWREEGGAESKWRKRKGKGTRWEKEKR